MWSFQPRRRRPAWSSAPRCATALFHPPIPTHWDVGLRAASRLAVIKGDLNPLKMSISLVGALEPWMDYDFPFSWEWNVIIPIDFHSIIFQRGRLNHQVDYHHIIILSHNSPYYHWFIIFQQDRYWQYPMGPWYFCVRAWFNGTRSPWLQPILQLRWALEKTRNSPMI